MRTWDGLPVSEERPHGATVAVWRRAEHGREWLLLHRAHRGAEYEGEWAWTPPAGARLPGEKLEACARRELHEEAGLRLALRQVQAPDDEWALFVAEASPAAAVTVDAEHDRFEWLALDDALARCLPEPVADALRAAAASVGDA